MRTLILGASGLIGGNLFRLLKAERKWPVTGTYFSYPANDCVFFNTLNFKDEKNFDVDGFDPDVIVHCGALTHVDYCETNVEESHDKTVRSTENAVELSRKFNARLVFISTDYVFDGKSGPYTEDDEVNPVSVYGKHKLEAEQVVLNSGLDPLVLRVTNVYGDEERGKNFIARLSKKAREGAEETMKMPFDQYATPVNAFDVGKAIKVLLENEKSGLYNIAGTDFMNRCQLANRVLQYFPENRITLVPVSTEEINPPAQRPLTGGLVTSKFLGEFPEFRFSNVDDYLKDLSQGK